MWFYIVFILCIGYNCIVLSSLYPLRPLFVWLSVYSFDGRFGYFFFIICFSFLFFFWVYLVLKYGQNEKKRRLQTTTTIVMNIPRQAGTGWGFVCCFIVCVYEMWTKPNNRKKKQNIFSIYYNKDLLQRYMGNFFDFSVYFDDVYINITQY